MGTRSARREERDGDGWGPGGRGEPARPSLRLVRGGGEPAARAHSPAAEGWPSVIGRARAADRSGPVEVRVWYRRPPVADAVYHPSGVWVAVRVL